MKIFLRFYDKNYQRERLRSNFVEDIPWLLFIHQDIQCNLDFRSQGCIVYPVESTGVFVIISTSAA